MVKYMELSCSGAGTTPGREASPSVASLDIVSFSPRELLGNFSAPRGVVAKLVCLGYYWVT